jgi:hypothetical protein
VCRRRVQATQVDLLTASQATHSLRKQLPQMLDISDEDVRCIYIEGAGCYGRNGHEDAAGDASLLAREVGRPVRVQWMRADEHVWDPKGAPTLIDLEAAGLDAEGGVLAWSGPVLFTRGRRRARDITASASRNVASQRTWSPATSSRIPQFRMTSQIAIRCATGSPKHPSGRPGFVRPDACKIHLQMSRSSMSLRRQAVLIRLSSGCGT